MRTKEFSFHLAESSCQILRCSKYLDCSKPFYFFHAREGKSERNERQARGDWGREASEASHPLPCQVSRFRWRFYPRVQRSNKTTRK